MESWPNWTVVSVRNATNWTEQVDAGTEDEFSSKLTEAEDYVIAACLTLSGIVSLVFNILVLVVDYRCWRHLTASDVLVANVAVCDVIMVISMWPLIISSSFSHRWVFGHEGCVAYAFLGYLTGLTSILSLAVLSFSRFITVCCNQVWSQKLFSRSKSLIYIGLIWVYAACWASTPMIGLGKFGPEPFGTSCGLHWRAMRDNRDYVTAIFVVILVLPLAVMLFSYISIFMKIRHSPLSSIAERSVLKVTLAICCAFLLEWGPYAIVGMWAVYGETTNIPVRLVAGLAIICKCLVILNPMIYCLPNTKIRTAMRNLFPHRRVHPTPHAAYVRHQAPAPAAGELPKPAALPPNGHTPPVVGRHSHSSGVNVSVGPHHSSSKYSGKLQPREATITT